MLPKRLSRKKIYKSKWINLFTDKILMPSGKIIEKYHFLDYPNESVVILFTNSKKEICFIKSPRYTTQKLEWELPAGCVEKGENIIQAAKREVFEETGYEIKKLKLVHTINPSNSISNQVCHIIFGLVDTNQRKDFDMDIDEVKEIYWFSLADAKKIVVDKKINDGISLLALLIYLFNSKL